MRITKSGTFHYKMAKVQKAKDQKALTLNKTRRSRIDVYSTLKKQKSINNIIGYFDEIFDKKPKTFHRGYFEFQKGYFSTEKMKGSFDLIWYRRSKNV